MLKNNIQKLEKIENVRTKLENLNEKEEYKI